VVGNNHEISSKKAMEFKAIRGLMRHSVEYKELDIPFLFTDIQKVRNDKAKAAAEQFN
jgi:hypothetical protein|tara:strand:+ start:130 stop:303 length:174 start_codon:yes stop_codon:yes gene_type:complete